MIEHEGISQHSLNFLLCRKCYCNGNFSSCVATYCPKILNSFVLCVQAYFNASTALSNNSSIFDFFLIEPPHFFEFLLLIVEGEGVMFEEVVDVWEVVEIGTVDTDSCSRSSSFCDKLFVYIKT